ncbi:MAG: hypothetical protein ACI30R_02660, partial [Sodaliphilus sp.]
SLRVHLIPAYTHPIPDGMATNQPTLPKKHETLETLETPETPETPGFCSDLDQFFWSKSEMKQLEHLW